MKSSFLHLALRHEDMLGEVFRIAHVSPQAFEAVIAGVWVEQELFDRVLTALNTVAGTSYTQEDIRDVCVLGKGFNT
jgi:hypothetical protein